ncbi:hypothetical protein QWJ34_20600 [Saccharibacillus sp. CPCC 101409]|uniref:hypothetical protein n=1 Tax=Saccharibacillus sp. CPCC 101409 TaxID=3058041 RepID=UPI0026714D10|nr:hypothetical protein [Saccharibacillus sp. CPCC 101409]MDO3412175.1 hypothetical protein [Saccharibacillus sp. CPCC 101409]
MLDLQDLLPYLLSISLLVVLRYLYLLFLYGKLGPIWFEEGFYDANLFFLPIPSSCRRGSPLHLSRLVRRREAPDDDGGDCFSSFDDVYFNDQRGGAVWKTQKDSFLNRQKGSFSL